MCVVLFCFCFFPLQPEKKRHMGHMTNTASVFQVSFLLYESEPQVAQSMRGSGLFVRGFPSRRARLDSSALCRESLPPALGQGEREFVFVQTASAHNHGAQSTGHSETCLHLECSLRTFRHRQVLWQTAPRCHLVLPGPGQAADAERCSTSPHRSDTGSP